jgi:hypothetical protein
MGKLARVWLLVSATIAVPNLAPAQTATVFDGSYAGVSRVLVTDSSVRHVCPPSGGLGALTIANGLARMKWADGTMEGQVGPRGALTMRATNGARFSGQIDGGGIAGRSENFIPGGVNGAAGCSYDLVWRKKP